ncbi:hypothetical protein FK481_0096 [Listeria phage LP-010]|uniref:Uncharacterized protein n=2 Tax=Homburgvirus LP114 TaxID=1921129 RepID=A0A514U7A4_9CAUD|nr:hypothetical protein FK481_0096 [Listeria phage LP-010]QDK04834.1 hypothetical protein FK484_0101 [Listeria phage LP-031]
MVKMYPVLANIVGFCRELRMCGMCLNDGHGVSKVSIELSNGNWSLFVVKNSGDGIGISFMSINGVEIVAWEMKEERG